jgi:hypothetical protein
MRRITFSRLAAVALAAALAAAGITTSSAPAGAKQKQAKTGTGLQPQISDQSLNCKQLSGRVQVLLLELRGSANRKQATAVARGMQSAFAATIGTNKIGTDPQGDLAADFKKLRDYNQRLVDKGCNSYDIDAELQQTDPNETPAARIRPNKAKTKTPPPAKQN